MKDYCFTGTNLSIGFVQIKAGNLMVVKEKSLSGIIGNVIHKYFRLDRPNFCSLQAVSSFGSLWPNGSASGALKLVPNKSNLTVWLTLITFLGFWKRKRSISMANRRQFTFTRISRPYPIRSTKHRKHALSLVSSNWGAIKVGWLIATTLRILRFQTGQILSLTSNGNSRSLHMFKLQIWLKLVPVVAFLLTFLLLFKLLKVCGTTRKANLIAGCLFEVDFKLSKSLNVVSLIVLFYATYFMIFKSIVSNNIKR